MPRTKPPAKSIDGREQQMVALAVKEAERQMREGTASPSIITHYLKLGTTSYALEKEKLQREVELLEAKADNIKSLARMEDTFDEAVTMLRRYQGIDDDYEDYDG